jgi:hypothetical protein
MKRPGQWIGVITALALIVTPAFGDTLVLKNGTKVTGYYEGGTARVVHFRGTDGTAKDYDIIQIQEVIFEAAPAPAPATTAVPPSSVAPSSASAPSSGPSSPSLRPPSERPPSQPATATAAATGYTVPTGTKITIQLVDAINSETSKEGSTFVALLDQPILLNGIEVAPRTADIRGRITKANEAGKLGGAPELGLELTQIYINGIPYALTTSEYGEAGESRTGQTVRRAGIGAVAGGVIGAVVGGGKGAAIGAGVGAGAGTASQVLTKGEKLNIPAETKLEFTLRAPLVIAAR